MSHLNNEPPHQDLRCLQIQLFSSLVVSDTNASGVDKVENAGLKVGSWSFEGFIILLIYFLNCWRKVLFQRNN